MNEVFTFLKPKILVLKGKVLGLNRFLYFHLANHVRAFLKRCWNHAFVGHQELPLYFKFHICEQEKGLKYTLLRPNPIKLETREGF